MRAERAFNLLSIYNLRTCPSLRCAKYDHRPYRSFRIIIFTGIFLNDLNFLDCSIHRLCHLAVHLHWIVTFYEIWLPTAAFEEILNFFMRKTGKNGRIADLISIHIHDRKDSTVCNRIQEFIGVPGSSQRTCLGLAITYYCYSNQFRIIQNGTKCMCD